MTSGALMAPAGLGMSDVDAPDEEAADGSDDASERPLPDLRVGFRLMRGSSSWESRQKLGWLHRLGPVFLKSYALSARTHDAYCWCRKYCGRTDVLSRSGLVTTIVVPSSDHPISEWPLLTMFHVHATNSAADIARFFCEANAICGLADDERVESQKSGRMPWMQASCRHAERSREVHAVENDAKKFLLFAPKRHVIVITTHGQPHACAAERRPFAPRAPHSQVLSLGRRRENMSSEKPDIAAIVARTHHAWHSRQGNSKDKAYYLLNLKRNASESDIKKAYHRLAMVLHPDKCDLPLAKEAFQAAKDAKDVATRNAQTIASSMQRSAAAAAAAGPPGGFKYASPWVQARVPGGFYYEPAATRAAASSSSSAPKPPPQAKHEHPNGNGKRPAQAPAAKAASSAGAGPSSSSAKTEEPHAKKAKSSAASASAHANAAPAAAAAASRKQPTSREEARAKQERAKQAKAPAPPPPQQRGPQDAVCISSDDEDAVGDLYREGMKRCVAAARHLPLIAPCLLSPPRLASPRLASPRLASPRLTSDPAHPTRSTLPTQCSSTTSAASPPTPRPSNSSTAPRSLFTLTDPNPKPSPYPNSQAQAQPQTQP